MLRPSRLLPLLLPALLAGCGGSSSDGATVDSGSDSALYLPLGLEDRWVYEVTDPDHPNWPPGEELYFVEGRRSLDDVEVTAVGRRGTSSGAEHPTRYYTKAGRYQEVLDPEASPLPPAVRRLTLFELPLTPGAPYLATRLQDVDAGVDHDGDGLHERFALSIVVTVGAPEAVVVPAGTFAEALKVRSLRRETLTYTRNGYSDDTEIAEDLWLVAGVGIVKRITSTTRWGVTETRVHALKAYRVSGLRSEAVSPAVAEVSPVSGELQGRNLAIHLTFDESIDTGPSANARFQLLDPDGQEVPGTLTWYNRGPTFLPDGELGSGTYIATLGAGTVDLLGNVAPADYSWSIVVDATPPQVVATTPASGALDVGTSAVIEIAFNEAIGPVYSGSNQVSLSGVEPHLLSIGREGHRLLIYAGELTPDTTYDITVNAVPDAQGNSLEAPYAFRFTTAPDLFEAAFSLRTALGGEAAAIGDVDGDGRNDALVTSWDSSTGDGELTVFYQQPDGTLSLKESLLLGSTGSCAWTGAPTSVAVGDLEGDGDGDVVIGRDRCGVEVHTRTGDGQWQSVFLAAPRGTLVRLGHLNQDDRIDIAATGADTSGVTVWLQAADSHFTASSPEAGDAPVLDLEIGDITADGLADIVLLRSDPSGHRVVILPQAADGGFAAPQQTGLGASGAAGGIGLGDVDNDGLTDVVVTQSGQLAVLRQQANGAWTASSLLSASATPLDAAEIADMTGDGRADVMLAHAGSYRIGVHRQGGDGTLGFASHSVAPHTRYSRHRLALGDVNGDGLADAVLACLEGIAVFLNAGD